MLRLQRTNAAIRRFIGPSYQECGRQRSNSRSQQYIDDAVWDHSVFSKNRDRLPEGDVAAKFM